MEECKQYSPQGHLTKLICQSVYHITNNKGLRTISDVIPLPPWANLRSSCCRFRSTVNLSTLQTGEMETLNKMLDLKAQQQKAVSFFYLFIRIINRYIHPGGKPVTSRSTAVLCQMFCLTTEKDVISETSGRLKLIAGIKQDSNCLPAAPSEGNLQTSTLSPSQKMCNPSTSWTVWQRHLLCVLLEVLHIILI